jgi:hypothetical protein
MIKRSIPVMAAVVSALIGFSSGNAYSQELSRATVQGQLIHAEQSGFLPVSHSNYPPTREERAHNRMVYRAQHPSDSNSSQ